MRKWYDLPENHGIFGGERGIEPMPAIAGDMQGTTGPLYPTVQDNDFFAEIGNPLVTYDQARVGDTLAEQARTAAEEQVAVDVSALLCQPAENGAGTDLAGLYLHLESVTSAEPVTV